MLKIKDEWWKYFGLAAELLPTAEDEFSSSRPVTKGRNLKTQSQSWTGLHERWGVNSRAWSDFLGLHQISFLLLSFDLKTNQKRGRRGRDSAWAARSSRWFRVEVVFICSNRLLWVVLWMQFGRKKVRIKKTLIYPQSPWINTSRFLPGLEWCCHLTSRGGSSSPHFQAWFSPLLGIKILF